MNYANNAETLTCFSIDLRQRYTSCNCSGYNSLASPKSFCKINDPQIKLPEINPVPCFSLKKGLSVKGLIIQINSI